MSSVSSVSSSNNSNSNSNNSSVSKSKKKRNISLKKGTKKKDLTRERLLDFSKEGITFLKKLDEDSLTKMIEEANQQYRNKTIDPTLTDNAYDIMENYVKKSYPHNKSLKQVGAVIDKGMVKLPYYLGSMDKIKPDTKALGRWLKKHKGPYVISGKLDGVSALYSTEGDKPKLWTRGNATKGMDISYLIPYLKGLPRKENIAIRGELIMSIKNFKKHFMDKYKNPRNLISGIVNSKQHEPEKWKYISFVGYEVIKPVLKPKEQMEWLEDNKVKTVKNITLDKITNNKLSEILVKWRNSYKYEVDGIVVSDNRIYPRLNKKYPDHSFAFKMILSDQRAESKVIDVIWTASKDGLLKPVVQYEPVKVKGADLEFATGKNARFIYTNKIGIGALIEVVRRGDVIPNVEKVITPAEEPKMPSIPWEWNAARIEAILSEKDKKVNKQVISKNIIKFFKDLDVIGLGPGNIKRMIKEGYDTVGDILSMTKEDFLDIDGFKEKKAEKIYNSIQEQISKATLITLMSASNMFGGGIGILSIKKIMKAYPDIVMSDDSEETKIVNIKKLNGFESKTAKAFVKHIPAFIDFIDEIGLKKKLKEKPLKSNKVIDESHILFGKKIVMTGFRDKELQARIESSGGKLSSKTTKLTFVVLTKDLDKSTGSMKIAEEFNIPIMTPEIFTKKYL